MLWGFTPAIDILEQTKCHFKTFDDFDEINILMMGCLDPRHILKTIAPRYRDDKPVRINFYLVEVCLEIFARHLLLLTVSLEPDDKLGLREKACLYMELFGNTLLRPSSANYLIDKTVQFIRAVTDLEFLKARLPFLRLDKLKYKERDGLENIFKFWQSEKFRISKLWDARLRHGLGTRYDSRDGAFDWDYHMRLKEIKGCEVINSREYMNWRETGVAFTWIETEFSVPNPTFAVGVIRAGDKLLNYGYHGDVQFGPYFSLGIECPDKEMFKTINGIHAQRSTDLVQRNLMRMFHEIQSQTEFNVENPEQNLGTVVTQIGCINIEDTYVHPQPNKEIETYSSTPINSTISFLPLNSLRELSNNPNYSKTFDIIYLSQHVIDKVGNISNTAKDNAVLIIETQKAFFTMKKEEKMKFGDKINTFARDIGCEGLFEYDPCQDYHAFFCKKPFDIYNCQPSTSSQMY